MRVPLMRNAFLNESETKKKLAEFILNTNKFSMGPECEAFEKKFAEWQGCKYAVLFNSGGSANLALLQSLKNLNYLHRLDRVGFSSLTWSTNVMPIIQMGMIPVPVDVDYNTMNVMSHNLEERIKDCKLDAFFATNVLGFSGDLDKIKEICDREKIVFIEDNCEGLGGVVKGQHFGNYGMGATFSFFIAHHMSTIEGGMVVTNNDNLYKMLKIVRANGWDRNVDSDTQVKLRKKFKIDDFYAKYSFYDLAYNFRPTEITGFIGQEQIKYLDENIEKRIKNHELFDSVIKSNPDLVHIDYSHIDKITPFGLIVLCKNEELRDKYLSKFIDSGIEVRPIIAGNMQMQPFYKKYVARSYPLPSTEMISKCGFYCGNFPEITDEDKKIITEALTKK